MKKLSILFLISCLSVISFSQTKEGHIIYDIEMSSDNPDVQAQIGMFQGSKMELYFKDKQTRSEMNMGTLMNNTVITDASADQMVMLFSGAMGNMGYTSNISSQEKQNSESKDVNIKLVSDTKVILGYTCKKALLIDSDGNESTIWYSEQLNFDKSGQSLFNKSVPGMALEFELINSGFKMTMKATKVETKLDKNTDKLFSLLIPEGYKIMTQEEMKQMAR